MQMQLNRNHVFVAKNGISIEFLKDKPTYVHPRHVPDVVALGATPSEEDAAQVESEMKIVNAAKDATAAREPTIEAAIRKLAARNQRGDFTAGGKPNLNVLSRECGFTVTSDEMDAPWRRVKAELSQ